MFYLVFQWSGDHTKRCGLVGQSRPRDDAEARRYLGAALQLGILFALVFSIGINVLAHSLIGFFPLSVAGCGSLSPFTADCFFTFMNQIFTASFICGVYYELRSCQQTTAADPFPLGVAPWPPFAQMFVFILAASALSRAIFSIIHRLYASAFRFLQDMLFFMLFHADCTFCRRLWRRRCSCPESRHPG